MRSGRCAFQSRLRTFKKLPPKTPLQMLLRGQNLLGYRHYGDDVVEHFVEKAAANGMDVFRIFDALNDPRNMRTSINAVRKTGRHAQGCICYTISPMHTIGAFVDLAEQLGVDPLEFMLKLIGSEVIEQVEIAPDGSEKRVKISVPLESSS